eukprot:272772-Rhodomonas_salina.1
MGCTAVKLWYKAPHTIDKGTNCSQIFPPLPSIPPGSTGSHTAASVHSLPCLASAHSVQGVTLSMNADLARLGGQHADPI